MDYKNRLLDFWGYIPSFHDDDIVRIMLENGVLLLDIKTTTNQVLHPKDICEKYEFVYTTLKFKNANINTISVDNAGLMIGRLSYSKTEPGYVCHVHGVMGKMEFSFTELTDIIISTRNRK